MKRTILTFATIIAFTAGTLLITSCSSSSSDQDESTELHEEDAHTDGEAKTTAEATHVCPMHPEETGLEGDKCSKCGMDLVASTTDEGGMEHVDATHVCPMHHEVTGLEGDKCSKCGMDLTLAEASEEEDQQ